MASGNSECCNGGSDLPLEPPVSGQGEFTQEFLVVLRRGLDNCHGYKGSWRHLACLLLNSSDEELQEFERLASFDSRNGLRSQTNEVLQEFMTRKGSTFDVGKFWCLLHEQMGRTDLAKKIVDFYGEGRLLHKPSNSSVYDDVTGGTFQSLATSPPQEGSDVCSVIQGSSGCRSVRVPVDQLTVTAHTVIINHTGRGTFDPGAPNPTTETMSLGSSSSGSSSSLPRDSDSHDQPKMVDIPTRSSYKSRSGRYEVIPRRKERVLISYADLDEPKAVDIGLHLNVHGYDAVLDNGESTSESNRKKKCQQIFANASAIVVVYSHHYKQEITTKKGSHRNTRFIYKLLREEFEQGNTNQRGVFYPMYQVQSGYKIPRIFNRLPSERSAALVHSALFVPVRSAPPRR